MSALVWILNVGRCVAWSSMHMSYRLFCMGLKYGEGLFPHRHGIIEKLQKAFIHRHLGVKSTTSYVLMLLETGCRPIEIHAMIQVLRYINWVRLMEDHRLPKRAWDASSRLQKTRKSKVLLAVWILDIRK